MKEKVLALFTAAALFSSCETDTQTGALTGAALGAGIGAIIGNNAEGALVGAAAGGALGAAAGSASDAERHQYEKRSCKPWTVGDIRRSFNEFGGRVMVEKYKGDKCNGSWRNHGISDDELEQLTASGINEKFLQQIKYPINR